MRTCGDFGGRGRPDRAGRTDMHMQPAIDLSLAKYPARRPLVVGRDLEEERVRPRRRRAWSTGPAARSPTRSRTNEHHRRMRRAGSCFLLRAAIEGSTSAPLA